MGPIAHPTVAPVATTGPLPATPHTPDAPAAPPRAAGEPPIERVFREEYGRVLATLIRLGGDFDLAEDALQEARAAAVEHWPVQGAPANPGAWLTTTARRKLLEEFPALA